jgi:putative transposase
LDEQAVRKTYKHKLKPTPEQAQALAFVARRCRVLYNAALLERQEAWRRCGVSVTVAQQSAQLPAINDGRPDYRDIHSHVLQEALTRLDRAFQRFIARVKSGETPGYPRFHSANRYRRFTYKQFGNGATLDNGFLILSKIGRIAVRWSRPLEGAPKTVTIAREADGWSACCSCVDASVLSLSAAGQETEIDLGIEALITLPNGTRVFSPGWYRTAERALKTAHRRVSRREKGSNRRRKAVTLLAMAHQTVRRQRQDCHHKTALACVRARHHLSRGLANGQSAQESPPRQAHPRRGLGGVSCLPHLQGSMRR